MMPKGSDAAYDYAMAHQDLEALVREYVIARATSKQPLAVQKRTGEHLKAWLDLHPGETITDGETGETARLIASERGATLDLEAMPDADILRLARLGCLTAVSKDALAVIGKANPRAGEVIAKYLMPGKPGSSLRVSKEATP